jgi:thiol-disulfide isomerase/thioredoxin
MDVFERAQEIEGAALDLGRDRIEATRYLLAVFLGDDAACGEHRGMGLGRKNIVAPEALVEVDGGVYLLLDCGGAREKAAAPHGVGHERRALSKSEVSVKDVNRSAKRDRDASPATIIIAALLAAIAGFGTVYWSFAPSDNGRFASSIKQDESGAAAPGGQIAGHGPLAGLNKGAMAAFLAKPKPLDLGEVSFAGADSRAKSLSDWRGKVVLLNIWATWCVPCREEMPTLDKLEAALGSKDFQVVAVNIDRGGGDKPKSFLAETGATHLSLYTDPSGKLFSVVKAVGMPTTLLLDREGREIGRLVGPAHWDSPEALALIKAAIAAPASA